MKMEAYMIVCVVLFGCVLGTSGLEFNMNKTSNPQSNVCGMIHCSWDQTNPPDPDIKVVSKLTIYDITNGLLAIVSIDASQALVIDPSRQSDVVAHGTYSRIHMQLDLNLTKTIDCDSGNFKCVLEYFTPTFNPDTFESILDASLITAPPTVAPVAQTSAAGPSCYDMFGNLSVYFDLRLDQLSDTTTNLSDQTMDFIRQLGHVAVLELQLVNRTDDVENDLVQASLRADAIDILVADRMSQLQGHVLNVTDHAKALESRMMNRTDFLEDGLMQATDLADEIYARLTNRTDELDKRLLAAASPTALDLLTNHTLELQALTNRVSAIETKLNNLTVLTDQILQGTQTIPTCQNNLASTAAPFTTTTTTRTTTPNLAPGVTTTTTPTTTTTTTTASTTSTTPPPFTSCYRGMAATNPRVVVSILNNVQALCDTQTDGGGWIVIQRRHQGTESFNRDWTDYKYGFGNPNDDYWLGNEHVYQLTSARPYELRVDLTYGASPYFAHYSSFNLGNENTAYELTVSGYSGDAGDSLMYHNYMGFSTFDQDNDRAPISSCAADHEAGWWYNFCYMSNLNGKWAEDTSDGICWDTLAKGMSVSTSEMKIRPL